MTQRSLLPGESFFSMLLDENETLRRMDFCPEVWPEQREKHRETRIGWWKSRIPLPTEKKLKLAPNDILLKLFEQLREHEEHRTLCYILTLLLIRRRLFRIEKEEAGILTLYCGKRDAVYEVETAPPGNEGIEEVQNRLAEMLYT